LVGRPLLVLAAAAAVAGAVASHWWTYLDLTVYRFGGRTVLDGLPLYAGGAPHSGLLFTYPPFAALGFAFFAMPPPWLVAGGWAAVSVAALAATLRAFDLPRSWLLPVTVAALALDPVRETLMFGQVNLALMALVSCDLLVLRGRWSGYLVGIAAGVKLTPLVFVGLLVLVGRRADALRALSAFTATVLLGVVLLPGDAAAYWSSALWDAGRVGGVEYIRDQSLNGTLTRLLHHEPSTLLWFAVAATVAVALLALAGLWWRRGARDVGVLLAAAAMLMCSPISWDHHFVWAAPLLLVLWRRARPLGYPVVALLLCGLRPLVAHGEKTELTWHGLQQVAGNGYTWLVLALSAVAAVALARRRSVQLEDEARPAVVVLDPSRAGPAGEVVGARAGHHVAEPGLGRGLETAVVHGDAAGATVVGAGHDPLGGGVGALPVDLARGDEQGDRRPGQPGRELLAHLDRAQPAAVEPLDRAFVPAVDGEAGDQRGHASDPRAGRGQRHRRPPRG
jgi:alpha-1,2-mannosyltransferase